MSETLKRIFTAAPTFEQDIPASINRPASGTFGIPPVGGRPLVAPPAIEPPITGTQTSQVRGAPHSLSFLADFMTALGAGVPAAQQQQEARRGGIRSLLDREQKKAMIGMQQGQQGFENRLATSQFGEEQKRTLLQERAQTRLEDVAKAETDHRRLMERFAGKKPIELNDGSIGIIDLSEGTMKKLSSEGDLESYLKEIGLKATPDELTQIKAGFKSGGLKGATTAINAIMNDRRDMLNRPPQFQFLTDTAGKVIARGNTHTGEVSLITTPVDVRKNAVSPVITTRIKDLQAMSKDIGEIEELLKDKEVVSSIGAVSGRVTGLLTKTTGASAKATRLRALTKSIADKVLRVRSGAQTSEQEYGRIAGLEGFLPNPNTPIETFAGNLGVLKEQSQGLLGLYGVSKSGSLTVDEAKEYLARAGGDKEKARQLAKRDGRTF